MIAIPFHFDYAIKIAPLEAKGKYLGLVSCALMSLPLIITPTLGMLLYKTLGPNFLWYGVELVGFVIFVINEVLNNAFFFKSHKRVITEYSTLFVALVCLVDIRSSDFHIVKTT